MKRIFSKLFSKIKDSSRIAKGMFVIAIFLIVIGVVNELFPYIGMEDIISFISYVYFLFAVVSFITYLFCRKEKDYEFILLAVTSVIIGAFFYLVDTTNTEVILGTGVLSFGLQAVCIRIYKSIYLYKKNDYVWLSKMITTILIALITILISTNLFFGITEVHTMLFGFYFIVYGVIYLLDILLGMYVKSNSFKQFMHIK